MCCSKVTEPNLQNVVIRKFVAYEKRFKFSEFASDGCQAKTHIQSTPVVKQSGKMGGDSE